MFRPPFRAEPPRGDGVCWTQSIVDADGRLFIGTYGGSSERLTFLVESLNANAYDPVVLADIEAVHPDGGWREAVEA